MGIEANSSGCVYSHFYFISIGPAFQNCNEVKEYGRMESGYYSMIGADGGHAFLVFCDLSSDDGQWTVIQMRTFGATLDNYHNQSWSEYRGGFGRHTMNYWLGNKYIHELTKTPQKLKITLHTNEFQTFVAYYEDFSVKDEASEFAIDFGSYWGKRISKFLTAVAFFHLRTLTYAQYASMNEFTCSEHSIRIRRSKKRSTGNQPLKLQIEI